MVLVRQPSQAASQAHISASGSLTNVDPSFLSGRRREGGWWSVTVDDYTSKRVARCGVAGLTAPRHSCTGQVVIKSLTSTARLLFFACPAFDTARLLRSGCRGRFRTFTRRIFLEQHPSLHQPHSTLLRIHFDHSSFFHSLLRQSSTLLLTHTCSYRRRRQQRSTSLPQAHRACG